MASETRIQGIRDEWDRFRSGRAGHRFIEHYERRNSDRSRPRWLRALFIGGGILLICVGLVLALIPGPAILFYAMGGALLASESSWIARMLDRVETWSRRQLSRLRRR